MEAAALKRARGARAKQTAAAAAETTVAATSAPAAPAACCRGPFRLGLQAGDAWVDHWVVGEEEADSDSDSGSGSFEFHSVDSDEGQPGTGRRSLALITAGPWPVPGTEPEPEPEPQEVGANTEANRKKRAKKKKAKANKKAAAAVAVAAAEAVAVVDSTAERQTPAADSEPLPAEEPSGLRDALLKTKRAQLRSKLRAKLRGGAPEADSIEQRQSASLAALGTIDGGESSYGGDMRVVQFHAMSHLQVLRATLIEAPVLYVY